MFTRRAIPVTSLAVTLVGIALATACVEPLEPGELGNGRFFGVVRGQPPLEVIPPAVDRKGNVYVAYGSRGNPLVETFVGQASGGWVSGCDLSTGTDGLRGWVGTTKKTAWYWAGGALVRLKGETGDCKRLLKKDPRTRSELVFMAIIPDVRETVSASTVVALVRGTAEQTPTVVVVDLGAKTYRDVYAFEPSDAQDVRVLGVGADRDRNEGYVLLTYDATVEMHIYSSVTAELEARIPMDLGDMIDDLEVAGYIQVGDNGMVAAALNDGRLLRLRNQAYSVVDITNWSLAGVHRHNGTLYVVGDDDGMPVVAELGSSVDASLAPQVWSVSLDVADTLSRELTVQDDRSSERRFQNWNADNGIGTLPFLSAHDPGDYGVDVTGWIIAGPGYASGGIDFTSVAHIPIGLEYP